MSSGLLTGLVALTASTATVAEPIAPPSPELLPTVHRYVVTIGFNASSNPALEDLKHADDDAARFFELLAPGAHRAYLLTRFDDASMETFTDLVDRVRAPSRLVLEEIMAGLREDLERDAKAKIPTEMYFFYAGHGDEENGEGYINLADGRFRRPDFKELILEGRRADQTHVIIDACKSYFMVAGRGPGGERRRRVVPFAGPKQLDGVGFVLSTSNDSNSHEWSALSGGIFSHEVRSALVGSADADQDWAIDYAELEAFVAAANADVPFPKFRPNVFIRPPPGAHRPVILDLRRQAGSWLQLDEGDVGRLSIRDHRGLRYADANKASAGRLQIFLSEKLRYDIDFNERRLSLRPRGGVVRLATLPDAERTVAARSEGHKAFTHLFGRPFTRELVDGYALGRTRYVPPQTHTIVKAKPRGPLTDVLLIGGGGLTLAAAVLGTFAIVTRNQIDDAPQVDRDGLVDRTNGLTVAAGTAAGVGITALVTGLILHMGDQ